MMTFKRPSTTPSNRTDMNDQLAAINALQPIAKQLRDGQEAIESKLRQWHNLTSEMVGDAAEMGRQIVLAKTKLGKHLKWSEWLAHHVPNLPETQAAKYERIATEQLHDPRQCVFAFLPSPERSDAAGVVKPTPSDWVRAWGHLGQFVKALHTVGQWPDEQKAAARQQMADSVRALGGKVEWEA